MRASGTGDTGAGGMETQGTAAREHSIQGHEDTGDNIWNRAEGKRE